jgi:hypothetical protein
MPTGAVPYAGELIQRGRSKKKTKDGSGNGDPKSGQLTSANMSKAAAGFTQLSDLSAPLALGGAKFLGFVRSPGQITIVASSGTAQTSEIRLCVRTRLVAATRAVPLPSAFAERCAQYSARCNLRRSPRGRPRKTRKAGNRMQERMDRTQVSFGTPEKHADDDRQYWEKAGFAEKLTTITYLRECFYGPKATTGRLQRIYKFSKRK